MLSNKLVRSCSYAVLTSAKVPMMKSTSQSSRILILDNPGPIWFTFQSPPTRIRPKDAGPLWMGLRLKSPRTESAYQDVIYPKGAYVLQMLRSMMYDPEGQDKA